MTFYREEELRALGIEFGRDVQIHQSALFFGANNITIGSNVRIDAYAVITSGEPVRIGSFVHIGVGASIFGRAGVAIADFCGLSPRACIITYSDDFINGYLTNPTVPEKYKKVEMAPVVMAKHSIIGCGSVVLPGVHLGEGAAIGALSVVRRDVPPFAVLSGNPPRRVGTRDEQRLRELEEKFLKAVREG